MCRYQDNNQEIRSNQTNPQTGELLRSEAITTTTQNQHVPVRTIPATTLVAIDELPFILTQAEHFDQNSSATTTLQDDWSFTSTTASTSTSKPSQ